MATASPTTFRLTPEDHEIIADLQQRTGLLRVQVVRLALRELRDRMRAALPMEKPRKAKAKTTK